MQVARPSQGDFLDEQGKRLNQFISPIYDRAGKPPEAKIK